MRELVYPEPRSSRRLPSGLARTCSPPSARGTAGSCLGDVLFFRIMPDLNESHLKKQLEAEGFSDTFVWQDRPNAFYPDHTHADLTAHIILDGEMTLTMNGESHTYSAGERCDVPAGATHSARMGPRGCRYLVGEK